MVLHIGRFVWIPCEVRPGPFSDERLVKVADAEAEWVGFVSTMALQTPVREGRSALKALILDVDDIGYLAQPMGHGVNATAFRASFERLMPVGPVAA